MATIQTNLTNLVNARKGIIKAINEHGGTALQNDTLSILPKRFGKEKGKLTCTIKLMLNDWYDQLGYRISGNNDITDNTPYTNTTGTKYFKVNTNGELIMLISRIYYSGDIAIYKVNKNNETLVLKRDTATNDVTHGGSEGVGNGNEGFITKQISVSSGDIFKVTVSRVPGHSGRAEIVCFLVV